MRRTAFPGIAEAWIARGDGTQGDPFAIGVISMSALCDLSFIGDVEAVITFGAICEIDSGNIDIFINMVAVCSTTFVGDVDKIIAMNGVICVITVTDP